MKIQGLTLKLDDETYEFALFDIEATPESAELCAESVKKLILTKIEEAS